MVQFKGRFSTEDELFWQLLEKTFNIKKKEDAQSFIQKRTLAIPFPPQKAPDVLWEEVKSDWRHAHKSGALCQPDDIVQIIIKLAQEIPGGLQSPIPNPSKLIIAKNFKGRTIVCILYEGIFSWIDQPGLCTFFIPRRNFLKSADDPYYLQEVRLGIKLFFERLEARKLQSHIIKILTKDVNPTQITLI